MNNNNITKLIQAAVNPAGSIIIIGVNNNIRNNKKRKTIIRDDDNDNGNDNDNDNGRKPPICMAKQVQITMRNIQKHQTNRNTQTES
jgi:hypothetical protein